VSRFDSELGVELNNNLNGQREKTVALHARACTSFHALARICTHSARTATHPARIATHRHALSTHQHALDTHPTHTPTHPTRTDTDVARTLTDPYRLETDNSLEQIHGTSFIKL